MAQLCKRLASVFDELTLCNILNLNPAAKTQGVLFVVGGADREQQHYQDCCAYISSQSAAFFESVKTDGDVPTERCGHSTAAYGKYVFLFGGIDFSEESVFNDLYLLDTGF